MEINNLNPEIKNIAPPAQQTSGGTLNARSVMKDTAQLLMQKATVRKAAVLFAVILSGSVAYLGRQSFSGTSGGASDVALFMRPNYQGTNDFCKAQLDEQIKQTFFTEQNTTAFTYANFTSPFVPPAAIPTPDFPKAQLAGCPAPLTNGTVVSATKPVPAPKPVPNQAPAPKPVPVPAPKPAPSIPKPPPGVYYSPNHFQKPQVKTPFVNADKEWWKTYKHIPKPAHQPVHQPAESTQGNTAPAANQQPKIEIIHGLALEPSLYTTTPVEGSKAAYPEGAFKQLKKSISEFSFSDLKFPEFSFSLWSSAGEAVKPANAPAVQGDNVCKAVNGTNMTHVVEAQADYVPAAGEPDVDAMPPSWAQWLALMLSGGGK